MREWQKPLTPEKIAWLQRQFELHRLRHEALMRKLNLA